MQNKRVDSAARAMGAPLIIDLRNMLIIIYQVRSFEKGFSMFAGFLEARCSYCSYSQHTGCRRCLYLPCFENYRNLV